jgi:hypothetical protein
MIRSHSGSQLRRGVRDRRSALSRPLLFLSALAVFVAVMLTPVAADGSPTIARASAGDVVRAPVFFFVHLGDIWRYEESAGVSMVVPAEGKALGHPSWSLDGAALAWEETEMVGGRQEHTVVFAETSPGAGAQEVKWITEDASSPAVSPDGRYVLYETSPGNGTTSLRVVDATGRPVVSIMGGRNGCWFTGGFNAWAASEVASDPDAVSDFAATATATSGLSIAFDKDAESFPPYRMHGLPRLGRAARASCSQGSTRARAWFIWPRSRTARWKNWWMLRRMTPSTTAGVMGGPAATCPMSS